MGFETILMLAGIGVLAGISAGFIGIGGGVIMVPVLLELFRAWDIPTSVVVQTAMATSLTVGTLSVTSSAIRHQIQKNVLWKIVPALVPSSMVGGWFASITAKYIPGNGLQFSLAFVLGLAALKMLFEKKVPDKEMKDLPVFWWIIIGVGVGLFSGYTGLAGGIALIPAMAYIAHIDTKKLAGTSSAVVAFTALAAAIGYMTTQPSEFPGQGFTGHVNLAVALSLAVTSIPSAQLGAWLNKKAGSVVYKKVFGVLLLFVVIRLFLTA